ncbi:bifunctional metallophosphatase/5'-nucleotidase [Georgenia sp. H159]|uniref:bifunctional metallophosphatase/5'-nucleotidase n=1 Tax=Georgenia sp. H159 TaxID=3076115 RepID=UPI002D76DC24|nr:5'-nucleotidase C-terminal domain-containing protein [Georgenia sp. H159]
MRRRRRTLRPARTAVAALGVAGVATLGLGAVPAGAVVEEDGDVVIDLVGINDFHGRISTEDSNGAVALASAVQDVRAANADSVFVSAGDNFGASTFTSMINDDVPTLEILNELDLAVSALGNHEFDQGLDTLWERIDGRDATGDDAAWPALEFPYLGANVVAPGERQFQDYHVHTVEPAGADPVSIGFIGLLTEDMPSLVAPSGIEGMEFTDMTEAALEAAAELTDGVDTEENGEADIVVVLVHEGASTEAGVTDPSTDFGALVGALAGDGRIDAVFSGHTHAQYEVAVERDAAAPMAVIQTGSFSDALGQVTLTYDPEVGGVVAVGTELIALGGEDEDGNDWTYPTREGDEVVETVAAIVAAAEENAEELGAQPVGVITADLNRARQSDGSENRGGESTIGNLIADAQLWAAQEQQPDNPPVLALMNPGGIRADIQGDDDGVVTYRQVATAQPFGNTLVTLDLTGAQVVDVLEEQWQPDGASRPFLKLGVSESLFYVYDPEAPAGERISGVFVDGEEIDLDATYRIVTNSFLASGGDNFTTFAEGTNATDSGLIDLAAFVDFFASSEVVETPTAQRAVGVHWNTDQTVAHLPGDEISLDLSSLSYSTDEPKPEEVHVTLVDPETEAVVDLGTVAVDTAIVDTTDEVGRAAIRVTVPEIDGLEGMEHWRLEISDELTGTLWFDVVLAAEEEPTPTPTPTQEPPTKRPPAPSPAPTPPAGRLPDTGAETTGPLVAGAALVALGALLVAAVRRRVTT